MASVSKHPVTSSEENTTTTRILKLSDCICPICMYILIEPVTMPCRHELCMSCFRQNVQEANLTCPMCRLRISTWSRKAARHNTLIDQRRWKAIQEAFPTQVQNRIDGKEEDYDSDEEAVVVYNIAEPGEIRKEYEAELKKLQEEAELRYQEELKKSEELILALQREEENKLRDLEEQREADAELARKLNEAMNQDSDSSVFDTPAVQNFLSRSKRNGTMKSDDPLMQRYLNRARKEAGKKTPTGRKEKGAGDAYPYRCISPWEKEPEKPAASSKRSSSPSRYSDIFTRASRPGSANSEAETVPYVYVSSRGNSANPSPASDVQLLHTEYPPLVKEETPILPLGLDDTDLGVDTSLLPSGNLALNFSGDCQITDVELPFAHLSPAATLPVGQKKRTALSALSTAPAAAARASTASTIKSEDTVDVILREMAEADEEEVKEEKKESPGLPRSPSRESLDSISQELNHFKPIRNCPKTPPKRLPGGQVVEIPLVRSRPTKSLSTSPQGDEDGRKSEPTSPIVQRRLLQLEAERNAQVEAMSKGTCTDKELKKPCALQHDHSYSSPKQLHQRLLDRKKSAASAAALPDSPESVMLGAARSLDFDSGGHTSTALSPKGEDREGENETILPLECNLEEDVNASLFPPLPVLPTTRIETATGTNKLNVDVSVSAPPLPQFTVSLLPSGVQSRTKGAPALTVSQVVPIVGGALSLSQGKIYQMKLNSHKGGQNQTAAISSSQVSADASVEPGNSSKTPGKGTTSILRQWLTSPGRASAQQTQVGAPSKAVVYTSFLTPSGIEKRKEAVVQHSYIAETPVLVQQKNKSKLPAQGPGVVESHSLTSTQSIITSQPQLISSSNLDCDLSVSSLTPSRTEAHTGAVALHTFVDDTPIVVQQKNRNKLRTKQLGDTDLTDEPTTISETTDTSDSSPLKVPWKKLKQFPDIDTSIDTSRKDSSDEASGSVQVKRKRRKTKKTVATGPLQDVKDHDSKKTDSPVKAGAPRTDTDIESASSSVKKSVKASKQQLNVAESDTGKGEAPFIDNRRKAAREHKYISVTSYDSPRYQRKDEASGHENKSDETKHGSAEELAVVKRSLNLETSECRSEPDKTTPSKKKSNKKIHNKSEAGGTKRKSSSNHSDIPKKKSRETGSSARHGRSKQDVTVVKESEPSDMPAGEEVTPSKKQRRKISEKKSTNAEESGSESESPIRKVRRTRHQLGIAAGEEQEDTSASSKRTNAASNVEEGHHVLAEDKENKLLDHAERLIKSMKATKDVDEVERSSKEHDTNVTPKKRKTQMLRYIEFSPASTGKKVSVRRGRQRSGKDSPSVRRTKQTKLLFLPQHGDSSDEGDFEPDKSQIAKLQRAATQEMVPVKKSTKNQTKKGAKQIRLKEFITRRRRQTDSDMSEIESAASSCRTSVTSDVRLERSDFQSESDYMEYIEEQDRQLALQLQADFDLEARYNLNSIRRKGSANEYEFRQKNDTTYQC